MYFMCKHGGLNNSLESDHNLKMINVLFLMRVHGGINYSFKIVHILKMINVLTNRSF